MGLFWLSGRMRSVYCVHRFFFFNIPGPDYAYLFQLEGYFVVHERLKFAQTNDLLLNVHDNCFTDARQ